MATTIIIKAEVDTGNSAEELIAEEKGIKKVDDAAKSLAKTSDTLTKNTRDFLKAQRELAEADPAKSFEKLNMKLDAGNVSLKDMKKAVKEYQDIAVRAGEDSPIGKQAIERAAELKDRLGDLSEKVTNLGHDGRNMQAALQLGSTVISGYTAFQGVTAMLGVENENLLKVMTKLQAATSTLQAIEQIRAALEEKSFLMLKLKNIQLQIQEQGYKKLFIQLLKNPYVAIGAAIVGVIGFMSSLFDWETKYEKAVRETTKATQAAIDANERRAKKEIQQINDRIGNLKAEGKETYDLERKKEALIAQTSAKTLELLKEKREAQHKAYVEEQIEIANTFGLTAAKGEEEVKKVIEAEFLKQKATKDTNKAIVDARAKLHEANQNFTNLGLSHDKEANDKAKSNYEEYIAKRKELAEKQAAEEERLAKLRIEREDLYNQLLVANMQEGTEKTVAEIKLRHAQETRALIEKFGLDTELLKQLTIKQEAEINAVAIEEKKKAQEKLDEETRKANEKARQQKVVDAEIKILQNREDMEKVFEAQKELLQAQEDIEIAAAIEKGESILLIEEEYNKKREDMDKQHTQEKIAQKQRERDAIIFMEQSILDAVSAVGNLAIKNEEKAAKFKAIVTAAQMALDTAKAIGSVIAGATAAAAAGGPAAPFLIAGYIASGIATVMTNMKKAIDAFKQAKVGNAPTLSGASGGGGASGNGNVNGTTTSPQNNSTETDQFFGNNQVRTMPVIVLETEKMNNSQKRLQDIKLRDTI